ncbi:hypothetical protein PG994_011066 [Apiospora phragmitis]|uniref:Uncharacterized protein n=1 Tax=Apiospora phragmitis TaxID=2905665 RepID=A0ABR1TRS1_9PEZI
MLPIQSKVSHVEHVLEDGADPEPNAFHDPQNGILRHYSGAAYGNPHSRLYPQRSYKESPPVGTPHPLNNPWYHGFQPDTRTNSAPQQGPGPEQPQYLGQARDPSSHSTLSRARDLNSRNGLNKAPSLCLLNNLPRNDSPSVGAVQRKEKKNVAFSARDASSGFGEPGSGSGRAAPPGAGRKPAGAKDTNTLWAASNKSQGSGGRKTTDSRQKDAGSNSKANYAGETVDSFLSRLKSNSSKHDSPQQRQGGSVGGGSVRNNAQNDASYAGWNGQDNGFATGPPAAAGVGSNNGGWGGSNQWGDGQNNNNNTNFGGGSQGWNNNTNSAPDNSNTNGGWDQGFNTGFSGQRNSAAGSNQQQQPAWGSNKSGSKKNESPMQFGNGSNQPNGAQVSPVQGSQPNWGANDAAQDWGNSNNNNADQGWGNGNNNAGQDWGGGGSNHGGGPDWGAGSNHGGGGQDWGNTSNHGGQTTGWGNGVDMGGVGGDANDDSGWPAVPANNDSNVIGGGNGSNGSKKSSKKSKGSGGGSKKSWKQGDNNVGPSSHHSGDIPGAWPSSNDQQQQPQSQSNSRNGGNVMESNENDVDDFGDSGAANNNFNGGGADWHDTSAAQGTSFWEQEGKGTENVVQGMPGNNNNDALKTGGSSWW